MKEMFIDLSVSNLFEENKLKLNKKNVFIFGKNGTGKSTLAKIIKEQHSKKYDVRVFNGFEGVIGENKRLNAVVLGNKNTEINQKVDNVKNDIDKLNIEKKKIEENILENPEKTENFWSKVNAATRLCDEKKRN